MSGVPAIHHPLRHVNARTGDVGLLVQIADLVNRTAVNPLADAKFWIILQRLGNFHGAQHRRFRTGAENKRAAIASRQPQQSALRLSALDLLRASHDLLQCLQLRALLGDKQLRVTDNINEQDMADFESHVWKMLGRHTISFYPETQALTS